MIVAELPPEKVAYVTALFLAVAQPGLLEDLKLQGYRIEIVFPKTIGGWRD